MTNIFDSIELGGASGTPVIMQTEASECGLACLSMVAAAHGYNVDLASFRSRFSLSLKGATLKQLINIAEQVGFLARPLRGEIASLNELALPAVLHWDLNHFVVLTAVKGRSPKKTFTIHDPSSGRVKLAEDEFSRRWTGVALELIKSEAFRPQVERRNLKITQLWSSTRGVWASIRQTALLSVIIQIVALASPFYLQVAIDQVLPASDISLLATLAVGFGGLATISLVSTWLRTSILVNLNNSLSYHIISNLFRHLLRLPLAWFEKRHVGDIISRFASTQPISQLLSNGLVSSTLDGIMALTTLALMFVYSPVLALLAVIAIFSYLGIRLAFFQAVRLRNINAIATAAAEQSSFIESIRGIASIKSFGQEGNRQRIWQRKKADAVNASIQSGKLNATFDAAAQFVIAIERVVFVYVAVSLSLNGQMTIGMVFAFQAYKQQFLDAGMRLIEQAISFKLLSVHLSRLSDIALSPAEDDPYGQLVKLPENCSSIELQNVSYHYGVGEKAVISSTSLRVKSGEMIAFVGPSGGGKTTLVKIMMGLLEPTVGHILVDGRALSSIPKQHYRRRLGSVAQDDNLYAGSLAENISFFDAEPNYERIHECARIANIHDEIEALPLGYDSLVGDMGSTLSGGQKQRVLLARALYPNPDILFMDEGTANLDPLSENAVMESLAKLTMTRVIIAHRPRAVQSADRILLVAEGRVHQIDKYQP